MIKKIIIVSNTSWSLYNFRFNLAKRLRDLGYKVILIAPFDDYSERLSQEFEYHNVYINSKGTNPMQDINTTIDLFKLYKDIKPDLALHFTIKPNIYGSIASRILRVKTINNITGLGSIFMKTNLITNMVQLLYKFSQANVEKIFFQNKDDYNIFIDNRLVFKDKCEVLPGSGVDTKKFTPINFKKKNDKFIFLLIARMLWDKGIHEYIQAAKDIKIKHPNIEFQLLGFLNNLDKNSVSDRQMQLWVDTGVVNYLGVSDDVRKEISMADCIVLPSFYREGTPRTLLESASMAKPIITTDNVGCKDVVDDGINGYICKIKNADDLAQKMEKLLTLSDEELIAMGIAGRKKILKEFDEEIVIEKYLNKIRELI